MALTRADGLRLSELLAEAIRRRKTADAAADAADGIGAAVAPEACTDNAVRESDTPTTTVGQRPVAAPAGGGVPFWPGHQPVVDQQPSPVRTARDSNVGYDPFRQMDLPIPGFSGEGAVRGIPGSPFDAPGTAGKGEWRW